MMAAPDKEEFQKRLVWNKGDVKYVPPKGDDLPPRKKVATASAQSPDNSR